MDVTGRAPEPAEPEEEGVEGREPPAMQIEPARLLANESRDRLHDQGFDDHQIESWADTYVTEHGPGDVDGFVAWIADQERASDQGPG